MKNSKTRGGGGQRSFGVFKNKTKLLEPNIPMFHLMGKYHPKSTLQRCIFEKKIFVCFCVSTVFQQLW